MGALSSDSSLEPSGHADLAFQVEMLPAGNGDCLVVTVPLAERDFLILIDTGTGAEALAAARARLLQIPVDPEDHKRHLDLLIVTHLDEDHIEHAVSLLADGGLALSFKDIWFNGYEEAGEACSEFGTESFKQADELSSYLHTHGLSHNAAFGHRAAEVPRVRGEPSTAKDRADGWHVRGSFMQVPMDGIAPVITLLSPLPQDLHELRREWDAQRAKPAVTSDADIVAELLSNNARDRESAPVPRTSEGLQALAESAFVPNESRANVCSIVVLLENRGRRLLLAGDGHPYVYEPALAALRDARRATTQSDDPTEFDRPLAIDAIKVAHHGSQNNTTRRLAAHGAKDYLISTNGRTHEHPDSETLARLIVGAEVSPTFHFNFPLQKAAQWENLASTLGGFAVCRPTSGEVGLTYRIAAAEQHA